MHYYLSHAAFISHLIIELSNKFYRYWHFSIMLARLTHATSSTGWWSFEGCFFTCHQIFLVRNLNEFYFNKNAEKALNSPQVLPVGHENERNSFTWWQKNWPRRSVMSTCNQLTIHEEKLYINDKLKSIFQYDDDGHIHEKTITICWIEPMIDHWNWQPST